jgi:hypothetical protein
LNTTTGVIKKIVVSAMKKGKDIGADQGFIDKKGNTNDKYNYSNSGGGNSS